MLKIVNKLRLIYIYSGIPIFRTSKGNELVRKIGDFEKSGVKLYCLTEEGKQILVRVIERFVNEGSRNRDSTVFDLRWLETVSGTFQDVDFDW